jgi:hypothetical protein
VAARRHAGDALCGRVELKVAPTAVKALAEHAERAGAHGTAARRHLLGLVRAHFHRPQHRLNVFDLRLALQARKLERQQRALRLDQLLCTRAVSPSAIAMKGTACAQRL